MILPHPHAVLAAAVDRTPLDLGPAREPVQSAAEAGGGGGGVARMVVGLAVVIAVIYGLSWVLKQVRASREGQASGAGLAALSSLPLGPNRSVHLVRAGHELVLLGVAEQGVVPIRTYTEEEARDAGLLGDDDAPVSGPAGPPSAGGGFGTLLEALRERTVRR